MEMLWPLAGTPHLRKERIGYKKFKDVTNNAEAIKKYELAMQYITFL
jgi:hypothetical protein